MMIAIDSHQHFWSLKRGDYDWLTPNLEALYRDFMPSDLAPILNAVGVKKTVLVQATPTLAETQYLLTLADRSDFIAGVVGWVDMDMGCDAIDDLVQLAEHDRFLGVRPMIQDIDDPEWMLRAALDPVFRALIDLDLRFDALVKPLHLPYLSELLTRYPKLRTVIDHGAKPNIAAEEWEPWSREIAKIAKNSSAFCKLSGLVTEADSQQPYDVLWPYCQHLLDQFGAHRLMWGSDWPVLNLRTDYKDWYTEFRSWLAPLDDEERRAILGNAAVNFYGLKLS